MPNYTLTHTGEELDIAIAKSLLLQAPPVIQKNLLINGDFQVWQTQTRTISVGNQLTQKICDMYKIHNISSGAINLTIDNTSGNGLSITPSTTNSSWSFDLTYRVKSPLRNNINGKSVTISYKLDDQIYSNTFTPTITDQAEYDITTTISGTGVQTLHYVKLEYGIFYTPFISNPYEEELAACQRYIRNISGIELISSGRTESGSVGIDRFYLPIQLAKKEVYPNTTDNFNEVTIANSQLKVLLGETTISNVSVQAIERLTDINGDITGYIFSVNSIPLTSPTPTILNFDLKVNLIGW